MPSDFLKKFAAYFALCVTIGLLRALVEDARVQADIFSPHLFG